MIEEPNRLGRKPRETFGQEFAGILPQHRPGGIRECPLAGDCGVSKAETLLLPVQYFNPKAGQKFGGTKFCPSLKKASKHLNCLFINALQHYTYVGTGRDKGTAASNKKAKMKNQVQEINELEFEAQVLHSTQPVLVGFLAGWSKPCRLIEPVLDSVTQTCHGNARVLKVNVDDNPDLGASYQIQSVPTLIYFFNGTIRAKIVGMASSKAILARLISLTTENTRTNESERSS
jgi:thioredoxin 1